MNRWLPCFSHLLSGLLLLSSTCWTSCKRAADYRPELAEIIQQHYADLPTRRTLKPVYRYADWMRGRDSIRYQPATNVSWSSPPPPPDDTTLVAHAWLLAMGDSIPDFEPAYMWTLLEGGRTDSELSSQLAPALQLLDTSQLCRTYPQRRFPCQGTYYYFSTPLCNSARNICWFEVDEIKGPASSGWRRIYQKQGDKWVKVYARMHWIS
jgi:hypothetical protein